LISDAWHVTQIVAFAGGVKSCGRWQDAQGMPVPECAAVSDTATFP
jgi:hypothetical protein